MISGHRTTYGAPFYDLDLLEPGDRIEVDTAIGTHVYTVRETVIVAPTDVWVTDPRPGAWLTLTTCHPKYTARDRLIVHSVMVPEKSSQVGVAEFYELDELDEPDELVPGDEVTLRVKTTTADGEPTPAEVALSVFDSAVLYIQPEMIPGMRRGMTMRRIVYQAVAPQTRDDSSRWLWIWMKALVRGRMP